MTAIVSAEARVRRPIGPVFEFAAGGDHNADYELEVTEWRRLTPRPTSVGTRYAVTRRVGGISLTAEVEVTTYEVPTCLVLASRLWATNALGTLRFSADGASTLVTSALELSSRGPLGLFDPLLGWVLARQMRRNIAQLTRLLETEPERAELDERASG
jgi:hypothetical protein